MPNLPAHIYLAYQAASRLGCPTLQGRMGSFLLGSTAPDIRAMTKWPRERTHFASLDIERVGVGVEGMYDAYPYLQDPLNMNASTRAFIAGYINHLIADESWILNVYRGCFADHDDPEEQMEADIWDRAIQLDLDRIARSEMDEMEWVREALEEAEQGVEVEWIPPDVLAEWRAWVQQFTSWEFSWERLHRATRRMYGEGTRVKEAVSQFLQEMPYSLQRAYDLVSSDGLESYREATIGGSVKLIKEFLNEPADNSRSG